MNRMMRGPYCDDPITLGSGKVVKCGGEVAPRECKYWQCELCHRFVGLLEQLSKPDVDGEDPEPLI